VSKTASGMVIATFQTPESASSMIFRSPVMLHTGPGRLSMVSKSNRVSA
jgi:hypothetical protein